VIEHPARACHQILGCIDTMQESLMSTKLYVGNLPFETTEHDLQSLFEGMGQINTITIMKDRETGRPRGFAFIEMSDTAGARRAIDELDKQQYGGRSLTVNEARPMASRAASGPRERW
jgi:cold-inducible RNA-binding protein